MDEKLQSLQIGALLHDIGKLLQRSGGIFFNEEDFKNKKMSHSAYGYGFVKRLLLDDKWDISKCVMYHHKDHIERIKDKIKPEDLCYIVYEADNIAAGADRRTNDEIDPKDAIFEREAPLESIFNILKTKNTDTKIDKAYYLRTLEEGKEFNYPVNKTKCNATKACYQKIESILNQHLKDDKLNEIKGMPINKDTLNSLLQILEATTTYIPSDTSTGNLADISLYDHLKLTSAIASCMYIYFEEKGIKEYKNICYNNPKREEPYFLLVSGDLSGVQDFIYTISSKGALKSLRARSFYLDILLEHIADEILEKLELSRANLIYTGGGHFYMLLPNTEKTNELLKLAEEKINQWFINKYGITLYLALAWEPCCSYDFMLNITDKREEFKKRTSKDVFRSVSEKLSQKKLQRYTPEQLQKLLDPDSDINTIPKKNNFRECNICHTSQGDLDKYTNPQKPDEIIFENICLNCLNLYKFGKELVFKAEETDPKVITVRYYIPVRKDKAFIELPSLDETVRIMTIEKAGWIKKDSKEHSENKYVRLYTKNKWMTGLKLSTNLWMGDYNKEPEKLDKEGQKSLIEFEELANKSIGIKRLAVMRADVDNLGMAFVSGFDDKYGTLSRYTTLSRQLSLFFKHYINRVCKTNIYGTGNENPGNFSITGKDSEEIKNTAKNIVIVYSGGDDVFIVGAWNDILDFAVDLRRAFKQFTNDKLTFSAGIGFFNHSFPIYQMANMTGKLEDKAKEYPDKEKPDKDAVALFGLDKHSSISHVYSWEEFETGVYEKLKFFLDRFVKPSDDNSIGELELSTSFLYKLNHLLEDEITEGEYSINLARLAYLMARVESDNREIFKQIKTWALESTDQKQLLTAINLLIYLFREADKEKEKYSKDHHKMEVN
ncbi:MAG: type III-A CRISPR-associated protein Cas10/Csm1 [Cyanobacteriota bacterium]